MGFFDRLLGKKSVIDPDPNAPFMEHPTGQFKSAVDAMADAIARLRKLPAWNDWITFSAQGMGRAENSEHFAEIRMRQDEIQLDDTIDPASVTQRAGVPNSNLISANGNYSIAHASPSEAARILDVIFRHHLGIHPFPDQGDDYAVGAEW